MTVHFGHSCVACYILLLNRLYTMSCNCLLSLTSLFVVQVPDRGGRPQEARPPPEMPVFKKRTEAPQDQRQGGYGRGKGGGKGGGGRVQGGMSQSLACKILILIPKLPENLVRRFGNCKVNHQNEICQHYGVHFPQTSPIFNHTIIIHF